MSNSIIRVSSDSIEKTNLISDPPSFKAILLGESPTTVEAID